MIGGETLRFLAGEATRGSESHRPVIGHPGAPARRGHGSTLGRDPANDLVLDDPNVSRFHAEVRASTGDAVEIADLGSRNGTRVDGAARHARAGSSAGSEIALGPYRLVFDGATSSRSDERGSLRLDAEGVEHARRGQADPAADVAQHRARASSSRVIGESGAGKTTLMKILAGVSRPIEGAVARQRRAVSLHRTTRLRAAGRDRARRT